MVPVVSPVVRWAGTDESGVVGEERGPSVTRSVELKTDKDFVRFE